jgi:hypothetical protein
MNQSSELTHTLNYDVARHIGSFLDIKSSIALYLALHNNAYTKHQLIQPEANGVMVAAKDTVIAHLKRQANTHKLRLELMAFSAQLKPDDRELWADMFDIQSLCNTAPSWIIGTILCDHALVDRIPGKIMETKYNLANFNGLRRNREAYVYLNAMWKNLVIQKPQTHLFEFYLTVFNVVAVPLNRSKHRPWNNTPDCLIDPHGMFIETCQAVAEVNVNSLFRAMWQIYTHSFKWVNVYQSRRYLNTIDGGYAEERCIHATANNLKQVVCDLLRVIYNRFEKNTEVVFTKLFDANPDPTKIENFKRLTDMRKILAQMVV